MTFPQKVWHFSLKNISLFHKNHHTFMKAMLKQELADAAGVNLRTLHRWCQPYRKELEEMGMTPKMKLLPPHIVAYLSTKFCIDLP